MVEATLDPDGSLPDNAVQAVNNSKERKKDSWMRAKILRQPLREAHLQAKQKHLLHLQQSEDPKDKSEAAKLRSQAPAYANLWATSLGDNIGLSDTHTALALANHLSLAPCNDMPEKCMCGEVLATLHPRRIMDHLLTCKRATLKAQMDAHNEILDVVADLCLEASACVQKEKAHCLQDRNDRPDIIADFHDKSYFIDVTITHPGKTTNLHGAATNDAKAADYAHNVKIRNRAYVAMSAHEAAVFRGFAAERYGRLHETALNFCTPLQREKLKDTKIQT